MLPGVYDPGDVIDASLSIFVDGVEREHLSAEWEGHTSGGLPESLIAAGDGVFSRTGRIKWASGTATTVEPFAPVGEGRWVPRPGASVKIVAEVNGESFLRFTGVLGASTYSLVTDEVETTISDGLSAALQTPVTIEPAVLYKSQTTGGWPAYQALEQAGYGLLPPTAETTLIHAPGAFGLAAAVGEFKSAGRVIEAAPGFLTSVDGVVYAPVKGVDRHAEDVLAVSRAAPNRDAEISLKLRGEAEVRLVWSRGTSLLTLSQGGQLIGEVKVPSPQKCQLLAVAIAWDSITVWTDTSHSQKFNRRLNNDAELETASCSNTLGLHVSQHEPIIGDYSRNHVAKMVRQTPPKILASAIATEPLSATRGFENVEAAEVVTAWCNATLSTVWVDEEGTLVMAARDRLASSSSVVTDVVSERVFAGSWQTARDGVRSLVRVNHLVPSADDGAWAAGRGGKSFTGAAAVAYDASSSTPLTQNSDNVQFINWEDNVDVIGLDTNYRPIVNAKKRIFDWDAFNKLTGSWWAISFENNEQPPGWRWTGGEPQHETISGKLEKLGQRGVKLTHRVDTVKGGNGKTYSLVAPSLGVGTLGQWAWGRPMPMLRADWVVTWEKKHLTAYSRKSGAGVFTLDAGWYVTAKDARKVAEALAQEIGIERITFDAISMLWDPRKQTGDTITLNAGRWVAECIITGSRESWDGRVPTVAYDLEAKKVTATSRSEEAVAPAVVPRPNRGRSDGGGYVAPPVPRPDKPGSDDGGHIAPPAPTVRPILDMSEVRDYVDKQQRILDAKRSYRARMRSIVPPTYFYPDYWKPVAEQNWHTMAQAAEVCPFLIINPASGPGEGPGSPQYKDFTNQLKLNRGEYGQKIYGYVRTGASIGQPRDLETLFDEVRKYIDWYDVDGIFWDEAYNGWGDQAGKEEFHHRIADRFNALYPWMPTIVNPGANTTAGMVGTGWHMMTFENEASLYLTDKYLVQEHYKGQPRQMFWHCIHDITGFEQAVQVLRLADTLNVGILYLTDDTIWEIKNGVRSRTANPYDRLPAAWLWRLQIAWAKGELDDYLTQVDIQRQNLAVLQATGAPAEAITAARLKIQAMTGGN